MASSMTGYALLYVHINSTCLGMRVHLPKWWPTLVLQRSKWHVYHLQKRANSCRKHVITIYVQQYYHNCCTIGTIALTHMHSSLWRVTYYRSFPSLSLTPYSSKTAPTPITTKIIGIPGKKVKLQQRYCSRWFYRAQSHPSRGGETATTSL